MSPGDVRLALHEAGHAVVAIALNCTVDVVSIEPSGGLRGRCLITPSARTTKTEIAAFLLAGELVESSFAGRAWSPRSPHAWADCVGLVELLLPARAANRRGLMPELDDFDALATVPEFWQGFQLASIVIDSRRHALHVLAERLLARGTLRNLT